MVDAMRTIPSLNNSFCASSKYNGRRRVSANVALKYVMSYRGSIEFRSAFTKDYKYFRYPVLLDIHSRVISRVEGNIVYKNNRLSKEEIQGGNYDSYIEEL